MKNKVKILVSIVLSIAIIGTISPLKVSAKSIEDLEKEIANYQSQLNKLSSNNANEKKYQDTLTAQITALKQQMDVYESQISEINARIDSKNKEITALDDQINAEQSEIDKMQQDINSKEEQKNEIANKLRERMKEDYIGGKTSSLEVLLSSKDFGSFISNLTYLKKIAQKDKELNDELDEQVSQINNSKSEKEVRVSALNNEKSKLTTALSEVQKEAQKVDSAEEKLKKTRNSLSSQLSKSKQNSDAIRNAQNAINNAKNRAVEELEDATKDIKDKTGGGDVPVDPSSEYLFPVAQPCYISQDYKGAAHKGVDIATSGRPNPIYASRGGKVIVVMYNAPYGSGYGGYGNVVVIDHGDGYQTLYAHMSTILVSVGQNVNRGKQIGNVGSTGQSTGYHLHFELRHNGSPIKPPFHS